MSNDLGELGWDFNVDDLINLYKSSLLMIRISSELTTPRVTVFLLLFIS